jgi:valyl-tRNA synthetase
MGHAFNNTLQDILVRWHRMQGHDTLWQVGTDHAGIATQMVTERDMAAHGEPTRREMGREAFLSRVWQQKVQSRGTIIGQLQRLGASCDWDREAFTMSGAPGAPDGEEGNFHDAVIKVFVDMYHKGLIYRGKRLVNWDPHFETAISDLEVENIEVAGHMWHFKYVLAGGETYEYVEKDAESVVTLREKRNYISIATTRPETMLGDGAVAVHPSDARYKSIVGKMVHLPLCDRLIPIIADEYPDPTFGSGAVKITGAHDFNDYAVAKRNALPCYRLMDTRAQMRADGAPYAQAVLRAREIAAGAPTTESEVDALNLVPEKYRGLDRLKARELVIADINALGLCVSTLMTEIDPETGSEHLTREPFVESKKIMQPFGDRSKVVIEPMLTDQWFVDTAKIVEPALEAVRSGATKIMPESGEKTYFHWLENIEPWCISRQLWWGHQIPVWYGPSVSADGHISEHNDKSFCAPDEAGAIKLAELYYQANLSETATVKASREIEGPHPEILQEHFKSLGKNSAVENVILVSDREANSLAQANPCIFIHRDPDVLDTWFSSGLWPIGTLGWPDQTPELAKYFPTSTLITGADIIFFWVARMMMMQLAVVNEVPFKTVYLHGLVRDAKGKKMSKSLGNVIDPLEIIDEYGADALRFSNAAMASLGGVLKLDTARIAGYRNFGTKLWNACRFAEMNGVWEGHATQTKAPKATATANRWIIGETARALAEVNEALATFRFDTAADALYKFVWGRVCDWYVEFAKPLFDGPDAAETRATMAWVLDQSMILLHPIMPFITEDLWGNTGTRAKLLVHTDWPTYGAELAHPEAATEMGFVTALIDEIRSARAQVHVAVGLKCDLVATELSPAARTAWTRNEALIKRLARIDSFTEGPAPKGSIALALDGASFAIPLAGLIDIAEEKARLTKAMDKLAKEIGGLKGRLNNPNFATSAPEDVVEEARGNLQAREDEAAKLTAALKRLAELD